MGSQEIRDLLDASIDGMLTEEQFLRLDHLLSSDANARQYYVEEIVLVNDLERGGYSFPRAVPVLSTAASSRLPWGIAIVASAFALLLVIVWPRHVIQGIVEPSSTILAPIARIVGGTGAKFAGLQPDGRFMNAGRYQITEGAISLIFRSGASLEIEGPARFEIKNDMLLELELGNARIHAPESAKGFLVAIPGMDVRDLGTEFGVSVASNRSAEVHVFIGSVELLRSGIQPEVLVEGNAVSWEETELHLMDGVDDEKFATRSSIGFQSWEASRDRWSRDPAAVVYFDFEQNKSEPKEVRNRAGSGGRTNGIINGPIHVSGRWPEKAALLFEKGDDHVWLDIPSQFDAFTLSAWICATRRTELVQAIMMTIGDEPGEHHWQIGRDGSIRSGVQLVYSVFSSEDATKIGVWQHVAAVVDRKSGVANYFVNGEIVCTKPFATEIPLVFGPCTIGAWSSAITNSWSRRFRGRMDEFAIFSRALSKDEISSIFQDGSGYGTDQE
jgi:hypothetical protein